MTSLYSFRHSLFTVPILALTLSLAGGAVADDDLLDNGSITKAQNEPLKVQDEISPEGLENSAETEQLPPVAAAGETTTVSDVEDEGEIDPRISEEIASIVAAKMEEEFPVRASYGSKGFRLETRDGNWQTNLQWRFQFRFTFPYPGDPRQIADFTAPDQASFQARRLRMKIGGHGYRPWLKYYFEVDLQPTRDADDSSATTSARVIDWRVDVAKWKKLALRVGQWKIDYNRERVDSSGRQEFVERSIVNRIFTIDRQVGVQLRGRLFDGTPGDLRYFAGVFSGQGRGVLNDDSDLMYSGRLQWNFLGRDLAMRQTDVERTEKPTGSLGAAVAYTEGRCTRWSSSGCGNLDGFTSPATAAPGQFEVLQAAQDFAFKWQGFAVQQEFHWKRVDDRVMSTENDLFGTYAQVGYFFNEVWEMFPEPLELAFRYAWLQEPNKTTRFVDNQRQEFTAAANWFFAGHNNKLTLDYSHLTLNDGLVAGTVSGDRVRLQWDISF